MIRKYINHFLNKKSDFTKDDNLAAANDQFYYLLGEEKRLFKDLLPRNIKYFFKYKKLYLAKLMLVISTIGLLAVGVVIVIAFALNYFRVLDVSIPKQSTQKVIIYKTDSTMTLRNYLIQIAYGESRYIVNAHREDSQYLGIFQIGRKERANVGYGDISDVSFLKHEDIQVLTMIKLLKLNKKSMQPYIDKYSGKIVDGILVTESGILALCQLGTGSTQKWLDSGYIPAVDEFGNKPRELLKMGGYRLNLDKIDDNPISIVQNIK